MNDEPILPVEEMLAWKEFTDRVEILRELEAWVKNIQRMAAPSTAIISPRRMGKTVLLDRLVNTVFFKPEWRVAPFYFSMKRERTTLRAFLLEYAETFFRQFFAYCLQKPECYSDNSVKLEQLLDLSSDHEAVNLAKKFIEGFLNRYNDRRYNDILNQWGGFIKVPERLGSYSGIRVAVIIDEFQEMKFSVYDTTEDHFLEMGARGMLTDQGATDLTVSYRRQAQSRKAPMLVSGSAVTMIFRTVMGGALSGRFGFKYLRPLSIPDGAALLKTLLDLYTSKPEISTENALYASAQVGGHPYYLYCLSVSEYEDKKFDGKRAIDDLIRYEIEEGKIYGFWQTHFQDNRKFINADADEEIGKKIIYYFTRYNNQPVEIKEIAQILKVPSKSVEEKIERLYQADLVWRTAGRYYAFNDVCLMRFIKFVYAKDLEGVEDIDLSRQNYFNNLKGRFLELVVQITMMKFNHEKLDGAFFGKTGQIDLPLFQFADSKYAKGSGTRTYQIDVLAREKAKNRVWLCECKYTKTPMGANQVKKLEAAAKTFCLEAQELGQTIPETRLWLVSTGGFTREVLENVKNRADVFYSDYDGINGIFRAFGGNYDIPVFKES